MEKVKRALKTDDFTKLAIYSDPQVAPNGTSFAFVSTSINENKKYISHLYLQNLTEQEPTQWTFGDHKDDHPQFSPDGKKLIFQSDRSGVPQLWLFNLTGGEPKQITFFKNGARQPHWSENGKKIYFSAPLEKDDDVQKQSEQTREEREKVQEEKNKQPLIINDLKYKSDASGLHDQKKTQIVMYDLESDTYTQLTSAHTHHGLQDVSPDGNYLLFAGNLSEEADYQLTTDLYLLNTATKKVEKITDGKGSYHSARFSPKGDRIAFLGHDYSYAGATQFDLFSFDLQDKQFTCLTSDWDIQLADVMIADTRLGSSESGPVWSSDGQSLYLLGTSHGETDLYRVDRQGHHSTVYHNNNHVFGFSYSGSPNEQFILGISTPSHPGDFYLLQKDSKLSPLTQANRAFLNEVALSTPEPLTITTEDGGQVQGWLLKPYGFEEGKKYPFVLEVHGGPHMMYGQSFFHELQLLAAKGYVVLYTNPRGSYGYGQKFVDAVRGDYGGKDFSDLMEACDYVLKHYSFIDENRLGVTGGSYGGFMTNWVVGHTNRFKAAVTQRSISNWLSFYGVSDIGYYFTKWEHGYDLLDDPEKLWDFSPLKYAKDVETPLLILHGEQDLRCPIEQGEQFFTTLKHLRKEVEFVRFPGANHELSRSGHPNLRIERLNHILRWFDTHL